LLTHGRWFSSGTPASSTTKIGRHDIAEILLKVALKHQKSNQVDHYKLKTENKLRSKRFVDMNSQNIKCLFYVSFTFFVHVALKQKLDSSSKLTYLTFCKLGICVYFLAWTHEPSLTPPNQVNVDFASFYHFQIRI